MHELGLARGIVDLANTSASEAKAARVSAVNVRIGRLAGVEAGALLFCFDIAAEGTLVEGSRLVIEDVPVAIWCIPCNAQRELGSLQRFRCPVCDTPSGDVRSGKELEVSSIEVES